MLPVEVHRHAQASEAGWIIVEVMRDITERVEADKRLHQLAHYDALTGLPNRTLFYETLRKTLTQATIGDWYVAVLFIDLDHFKAVNDTFGHAIGDELLKQFSDRLVAGIRIRDTVGRLGGDEFALILVMQDGQHGAHTAATKIREVLGEPFNLHGHEVAVTASIGITIFPDDAIDHETLVRYADTAMYQAKQAGGSTFRFFTAAMNTEVQNRLELEAALRDALDARRVRPALPAEGATQQWAREWSRGVAALAATGPRPCAAGRVHPGARGDGAHRRRRELGDRCGLQADRAVAAIRGRADAGVGERLGAPVHRGRPDRGRAQSTPTTTRCRPTCSSWS